MKLHGNARLSPKGRLLLCRRVLDEGWSLAAAAKAVGVSERTASKWVARYRTEGEAGLVDRSSAPEHVPGRTDEERVELIASLRRLRMTGAEIAECLGMALSTVSGILTRIGLGKLSRARAARASQPLSVRASWRTDPHRRQEARADRATRRRAPSDRPQGPRPALPGGRLGVRACVRRRRHPLGLRRGTVRRASSHCGRIPQTRGRVLPLPRNRRPAGDDRQRQPLPLRPARDRLPCAQAQAPTDSPLPAPHQRQGRAFHQDAPRRLGLRRDLPQQPTNATLP